MMGIIVCQDSDEIIDYFEAEKVTILYSTKCNCSKQEQSEDKKSYTNID